MIWLCTLLLVAGCGSGGEFEAVGTPGAGDLPSLDGYKINKSHFTVRPAGQVLVVEQGKTPSEGSHGWISVNAMRATQLEAANGKFMVINKPLHTASKVNPTK